MNHRIPSLFYTAFALVLMLIAGSHLSQANEMELGENLSFDEFLSQYTEGQIQEIQSIDEAYFESAEQPFSRFELSLKNPVDKKTYEQVLPGPTYYSRFKWGYDYYRYVTFYNVEIVPERAYEFPIVKQKCHDNFERFAMFEKQVKIKREINAEISYQGLGLSSSFGSEESTRVQFNINAFPGYEADHVAYYRIQNWKGVTVIQTYNSKTDEFGWLLPTPNEQPISLAKLLFPKFFDNQYPIPFSVRGADREIEDRIMNKRKCNKEEIPYNPRTRNSRAQYED